jgi:branched-chain amino acid transport system substrate-binding protein
MKLTTKSIVAGIVILIAVIGVAIVSGMQKPTERGVVRIGIIAPLTGNAAHLGEGVKHAISIAEAKLADQSGNKWKYEIIVEDDAFDVKNTASAANKLIATDRVVALMSFASAAGNVVSPIAQQNSIVHFGIASDPTIAKGEFNYIHWTPPAEEMKVFIPELKKRGHKRVAVLGANIQGITAVIDQFEKDIVGTDITMVSKQIFDFGTTDYRTQIAKAQASNPDIYFVLAFSPELELVTKQLKEQGVTQPITTVESFELSDNPTQYEGLWYVNAADTSLAFNNAFQAVAGKAPTAGAGNAHDIILLIATAAEAVDSDTPPTAQQIQEKLAEVSITGALGKLTIDPQGFVQSKAVLRIIKDGKPMTISQ